MTRREFWQGDKPSMKPTPGGRYVPEDTSQSHNRLSLDFEVDAFIAEDKQAPLSFYAQPILNALHGLRTSETNTNAPHDIEALRQNLMKELDLYKARLQPLGIDEQQREDAHYILCATIDDAILSTPWGLDNKWARQSLTATLHQDVDAGEGFFAKLKDYTQTAGTHQDILLLFYLCLSLGFKGKYRFNTANIAELTVTRDNVYGLIAPYFTRGDRDLSPHYKGTAFLNVKDYFAWAFGIFVIAGVLMLATYATALIKFDTVLDRSVEQIALAEPREPAVKKVIEPPKPPVIVAQPSCFETSLKTELPESVTILCGNGQTLVRFGDTAFFESGAASLTEPAKAIIQSLGAFLQDKPVAIEVIGHTDSLQPGRGAPYASNAELSLQRAVSVETVIANYVDPAHIKPVGRGADAPIATNRTAEGRAKNRRIDITITPLENGATP